MTKAHLNKKIKKVKNIYQRIISNSKLENETLIFKLTLNIVHRKLYHRRFAYSLMRSRSCFCHRKRQDQSVKCRVDRDIKFKINQTLNNKVVEKS